MATKAQNQTQTTRKNEETSPLREAEFSDGDLGRIQGILFGDQARKTTERIDSMELSLLAAIAEMQKSFSTQIEALWARIEDETDTRSTAVSKLGERLDGEVTDRTKAQSALKKDLAATSTKMNDAVDRVATASAEQIQKTRSALTAQFESEAADLRNKGLTRESLASILSASVQQLRSEES